MELNDLGNYDLGAEMLQFISVVERGDDFVYLFSVQNGGVSSADEDGTAERTTLDVTLDAAGADNATLTGGQLYFISDTGAISGPIAVGATGGDTVSFGPYDHPVGFTAVFVVSADADKVGNAHRDRDGRLGRRPQRHPAALLALFGRGDGVDQAAPAVRNPKLSRNPWLSPGVFLCKKRGVILRPSKTAHSFLKCSALLRLN